MNVAIVNCFDTYEHRVDLLVKYFKSNDDNVKVYTSNYKHIEKCQRNDLKENFIYLEALPYKKNLSIKRMYSHFKLSNDIFRRLEYQKIDLLWVLVPPNSFVKDAAKYKQKHPNVKLIFDVIDMWPETMPINKIKNLYPIKKWKILRDKYIDIADQVVTECELYQNKLVNKISKEKMTTVYLAREIKPFNSIPNLSTEEIVLCYLGSINNIIDIPAICKIISELRLNKPVVLHIIGDGEKRSELILKAKEAGAKVFFHGKIYDEKEKQNIFDKCHFGLNIMRDSVFVGLTMKSIDYFEAGLPIINNIQGDTWDIVSCQHVGVNIDQLNKVYDVNLNLRNSVRNYFEDNLGITKFNKKIENVLERMKL